MYRVFNMGVGMVVIVSAEDDGAFDAGDFRWKPFRIGRVVKGEKKVRLVNLPAD